MGSQEFKNLVGHKRVALETSVFILALEGNQDFPQASELFRVLAVARAKMFASVLTITEVINKSYEIGDTKRIPARLNFIHGGGSINIIDVTQAIALKAAQLRAKYHLKTPDAIHLATAIEANCDLFFTADKDFQTTITEVKIVHIEPTQRV